MTLAEQTAGHRVSEAQDKAGADGMVFEWDSAVDCPASTTTGSLPEWDFAMDCPAGMTAGCLPDAAHVTAARGAQEMPADVADGQPSWGVWQMDGGALLCIC